MRVYWTNRAKARLRLIYNYIAEDSPKIALQVVDRVTTRSQQLRDLPRSGRQVPEYNQPDIRELLERPYRIIYKIKSSQVDVLSTSITTGHRTTLAFAFCARLWRSIPVRRGQDRVYTV